jgi:hypothetical protein
MRLYLRSTVRPSSVQVLIPAVNVKATKSYASGIGAGVHRHPRPWIERHPTQSEPVCGRLVPRPVEWHISRRSISIELDIQRRSMSREA